MAKARVISELDAQALTSTNARVIARTRLEEMQVWGRYAHDPQRSDELHNLRIAAKRLRYTLEIFADVLPEESSSVVEEVTLVQEELGALHDSDVMVALLSLCLEQQQHRNGKHAQAMEAQQKAGKHLITNLDLVTHLLDTHTVPTQEQRDGLEHLLHYTQQQREEQYRVFREHWDILQARSFHQEVLDLLDV
ncbi:MAG: hypothetical protein PVS3B3_19010 [Ktedonobacteraceae bacterium]